MKVVTSVLCGSVDSQLHRIMENVTHYHPLTLFPNPNPNPACTHEHKCSLLFLMSLHFKDEVIELLKNMS